MRYFDFTRPQLEAAMKLKMLSYSAMSEALGISDQSVRRYVAGTMQFASESTEKKIISMLQPEVGKIAEVEKKAS